MEAIYKLNFNGLREVANTLQLKFTGKSQMIEAMLGALETLNPLGGTAQFAQADAQFPNVATFAGAVAQEDGTRIDASNSMGGMFINCFAIVKRIEVSGGMAVIMGDSTNIFQGAPVMTGDFYHGGLMVAHRESITFTPDSSYIVNADQSQKNTTTGRMYWEGEIPFGAFSNFCIACRNTMHNVETGTNVTFYFDRVLPMSVYHDYMKRHQAWGLSCGDTPKVWIPETATAEWLLPSDVLVSENPDLNPPPRPIGG